MTVKVYFLTNCLKTGALLLKIIRGPLGRRYRFSACIACRLFSGSSHRALPGNEICTQGEATKHSKWRVADKQIITDMISSG